MGLSRLDEGQEVEGRQDTETSFAPAASRQGANLARAAPEGGEFYFMSIIQVT